MVAISKPAKAGPTARELLTAMELSASAFMRCLRPARSLTRIWRAGF